MPTPADLVALEDAWVAEGIREEPPGSNRTRLGALFGWNGVAWCAITQTLAIGGVFGGELYRSAAVVQWIDAAGRGIGGMELLPADAWIEPGMLVTYDFKGHGNPADFHIAMVRDAGTQEKFQTCGGNEGDAMRHAWRDRKYVSHFIRLPFDIPGDDDLTPDDRAQLDNVRKDVTTAIKEGRDTRTDVTSLHIKVDQAIARLDEVLEKLG